jgi:hypothetical protein
MAERRWAMQRGTVPVWQRLRHGPRPSTSGRAQARRARRGSPRPSAGGLAAVCLLAAVVAGWAGV